jgi:hypothetical protein
MAKEVSKVVKLQVRGGAANPSPPVGPALGAAGVNIMEFCKQFNARTQDKQGKVLPFLKINHLIFLSKLLLQQFSYLRWPKLKRVQENQTERK